MALDNRTYLYRASQAGAASVDAGLRAYMLRVYNYMASGVALTGIIAWVVAFVPAVHDMFFAVDQRGHSIPGALTWVAIIGSFGIAIGFRFAIASIRASTAQAMFWAFAALMGIWLAPIFEIYTGASIARVFLITAGAFAGLSLYGYTTTRSLSGLGSFLVMGLWGIILASLVSFFLPTQTQVALNWVISCVSVLVFAGLTAWDTQKIKEMYWVADDGEVAAKKSIIGALELYLDFINLFITLLRFFGEANRR